MYVPSGLGLSLNVLPSTEELKRKGQREAERQVGSKADEAERRLRDEAERRGVPGASPGGKPSGGQLPDVQKINAEISALVQAWVATVAKQDPGRVASCKTVLSWAASSLQGSLGKPALEAYIKTIEDRKAATAATGASPDVLARWDGVKRFAVSLLPCVGGAAPEKQVVVDQAPPRVVIDQTAPPAQAELTPLAPQLVIQPPQPQEVVTEPAKSKLAYIAIPVVLVGAAFVYFKFFLNYSFDNFCWVFKCRS